MTSGSTTIRMIDAVDVVLPSGHPLRVPVDFEVAVPEVDTLPVAGTFVANAVETSIEKLFGYRGGAYRAHGADAEGHRLADRLDLPLPRRHALVDGDIPLLPGSPVYEWGSPHLVGFELSAATARIGQLRKRALERLVVAGGVTHVRTEMPVWFAEPAACAVYLMDRTHRPRGAPTFDLFDPGRLDDAVRMAAAGGDRRPRIHGSIMELDPSFDEHRGTRFARGFSAWAAKWSADNVLEMDADLVRHWHAVGAVRTELEPLDVEAAADAALQTVRFVERLVQGEAGEEARSYFGRRWERILSRVEIENLPFQPRAEASPGAQP